MREAYLLLEEGASVQIDKVLTDFGLPADPFDRGDDWTHRLVLAVTQHPVDVLAQRHMRCTMTEALIQHPVTRRRSDHANRSISRGSFRNPMI